MGVRTGWRFSRVTTARPDQGTRARVSRRARRPESSLGVTPKASQLTEKTPGSRSRLDVAGRVTGPTVCRQPSGPRRFSPCSESPELAALGADGASWSASESHQGVRGPRAQARGVVAQESVRASARRARARQRASGRASSGELRVLPLVGQPSDQQSGATQAFIRPGEAASARPSRSRASSGRCARRPRPPRLCPRSLALPGTAPAGP
jgi:hypothetical protein